MRQSKWVHGRKLVFMWEGGEYIDVCFADGEAFDCINTISGDGNGELQDFTHKNFWREICEYSETITAYDLSEYALAMGMR